MATAAQEEMRSQFREARVGQVCALTVALDLIGAGTYVAIHGSPWPGVVLGSGGVLQGVVGQGIAATGK